MRPTIIHIVHRSPAKAKEAARRAQARDVARKAVRTALEAHGPGIAEALWDACTEVLCLLHGHADTAVRMSVRSGQIYAQEPHETPRQAGDRMFKGRRVA